MTVSFKRLQRTLLSLAFVGIACYARSQDALPSFASADIGNPAPKTGSTKITRDGKGIHIDGYGTMFGMHLSSDMGHFAYTKIKGDFDIIVQVDSVWSSSNAYAEGGLMVRKDLNPGGLMLGMLVTNNNSTLECDKYTFEFRVKEMSSIEPYDRMIEEYYGPKTFGTPAFGYSSRGWEMHNAIKRPFPWVWLRLIRKGNSYTAFIRSGTKEDWGKWEKMSEISLDLGEEPFVGFALSANHHHPRKYGQIGDPASLSTIDFFNISGFPSGK